MVAFYLPGGAPVYLFSLLLGLGSTIGLAWVAWQAPFKQVAPRVNAGLWAILGALVGGRCVFVAVNWAYFRLHPLESWQISLGGLSWPGALSGGLVFLAVYARIAHLSLAALADALLPLPVTLSVGAWLGCWWDGCAYSWPVNGGWGIWAGDEMGRFAYRFPLQLAGALLALCLFWLLDLNRKKLPRAGSLASLSLLGLSLEILGLSFLRADPALHWLGLRLDSWAALGFALLGAAAFAWILARPKMGSSAKGEKT